MQNSRLIRPSEECFWVKAEDLNPGQTDPKVLQPLRILLLGPADEAMGDFNERIMLVSHRKLRTET